MNRAGFPRIPFFSFSRAGYSGRLIQALNAGVVSPGIRVVPFRIHLNLVFSWAGAGHAWSGISPPG
jgi:hypothetical protein